MSSISALQAPGLVSAPPAKPESTAASQTASSDTNAAALQAPAPVTYPSPTFAIDPNVNKVIIEYRNASNGDVTQQIPPKSIVRLYETGAATASGTASPSSSSAV